MPSSQTIYLTCFISILLIFCSCTTQTQRSKKLTKKELCTSLVCRNLTWTDKFKHCGTFIHECGVYTEESIKNQYSLQGFAFQYDPINSGSSTYVADREAFLNSNKSDVTHQIISPPQGISSDEFVELIRKNAKTYRAIAYWPYGPNSNSAADYPLYKSGVKSQKIKGALGLHHYHKDSELDEIKNNAIKLFYEYASSKTKDLIDQIETQVFNNGAFKNLNIGDDKLTVINSLQKLKAFYITTQDDETNDMIDLRSESDADYKHRLLSSNIWNVTYDDDGKEFWFLRLNFENEILNEINVKSSKLELP